jgi:ACT domain-containing protein
LSIRHYDEVGVLAQVLQALRRSGHNVQQMQNQVFVGSGAAVASIGIKGVPEQDLLDQLSDIAEVIGVSASPNSPRDRIARRDR